MRSLSDFSITMQRLYLVLLLLAALGLHLLAIGPFHFAPGIEAALVLLFCVVLPGWALVGALLATDEPPATAAEFALCALAAGYALAAILMLLLSYLPGPLERWQVLLAFDLLNGVAGWLFLRAQERPFQPFAQRGATSQSWLWIGGALLFVVGGWLRFGGLGYAEFQGDEARAVLRAAAILQGYEDVLFLHKKGPVEILLPGLTYTLSGRLTELSARLLFAFANLAGAFALWSLGRRWIGLLGGWVAAMFLALDGYFIGFAHIVQYQSIVLLNTVVILILVDQVLQAYAATAARQAEPKPAFVQRRLILAGVLLAVGIWAHYEAALVGLPVLLLIGFQRDQLRHKSFWWATLWAGVSALLLIGLFFVPFALHPNFAATYNYLAEERIGHLLCDVITSQRPGRRIQPHALEDHRFAVAQRR